MKMCFIVRSEAPIKYSCLVCIGLLVTSPFLSARCQLHIVNWWGRLSAIKPVSSVFAVEFESQFRRQNNAFREIGWNPLHEHLTHSLRLFLHYRPTPKISVTLSPFAWFASSRIIVTPSDANTPLQHEFRHSGFVEWMPPINKKLAFAARSWAEYRNFQFAATDLLRFRQRFGLRYTLNGKWTAFVANELLMNVYGIKGYDHNRVIFNLNYKPTPQWRIELGYMYINRLIPNRMIYVDESNLITHFYYTLVHKKK